MHYCRTKTVSDKPKVELLSLPWPWRLKSLHRQIMLLEATRETGNTRDARRFYLRKLDSPFSPLKAPPTANNNNCYRRLSLLHLQLWTDWSLVDLIAVAATQTRLNAWNIGCKTTLSIEIALVTVHTFKITLIENNW